MDKHTLLLELGCEELPEKQLLIAVDSVGKSFNGFLSDNWLTCGRKLVSQTPRRIILMAEELEARQQDVEIMKTGPAVGIAYTPTGELSPAGMGFIRKAGSVPQDSFVLENEKGRFIAVKYIQKGQETAVLLQAWIPQLIGSIPFGKTMVWKNPAFKWSRPLRWILALWQDKALKIDFYNVPYGDVSYGNRYLGLDKQIKIDTASTYLDQLRRAGVIADVEERRQLILTQLQEVLSDTSYKVVEDLRLVDTVCNLVESSSAVVGEFEKKYLTLPEKIIISTISQNQKYFSVQDAKGKLSNKFVFFSNGDPNMAEVIAKGNQKVVNARLADALWYFQEDTKHPLEWFVPKLKDVVFQSKLGTMADKVLRIKTLCRHISGELHLTEEQDARVMRCAALCKADLVTTMLGEKEFTKLQGYIGMQYALASGEDPEVATGIHEHYMPRGSADDLPQTLCGSIVAIADKMDSIAGIIGIGQMPTGSGDPFALRRAANGIVQIISARKWDIDLFGFADSALNTIQMSIQTTKEATANVHSFMEQRVVWLLSQEGIAYDVINSVMHIDKSHINDLEHRARALNDLKTHKDFIKLVIGFKRVANIIAEDKGFSSFDTALLTELAEKDIATSLSVLSSGLSRVLDVKDYNSALEQLISFGARIDRFFDEVLVNCEDKAVQNNRHTLMMLIRKEFLRVADISLIVVEGENKE